MKTKVITALKRLKNSPNWFSFASYTLDSETPYKTVGDLISELLDDLEAENEN